MVGVYVCGNVLNDVLNFWFFFFDLCMCFFFKLVILYVLLLCIIEEKIFLMVGFVI